VEIVTLAERPDLEDAQWALTKVWPEFMLWDPIGDLYYDHLDRWAEFALVAIEDGAVVARGFSVPFAMGSEIDRDALPPDGWDRVIQWAHRDHVAQRQANTVAALEIALLPEYRGKGLAFEMLGAVKENAARLGFHEVVIPVRPSRKHLEPDTPMAEYMVRLRPDGLPEDPWLRLHVRAGGSIVRVCPTSMTISGTLAQWRAWTGLPFDTSGDVVVSGALVPIHVSVEEDHAVYVEPNVWVRHTQ
jgi:GNAT superfamily N-acetyltransferase